MKTPSAPNPYQQAGAQQNADAFASQASSVMNNPNIYTPWGSQTYSISGYDQIQGADGQMRSVPRYNQVQTLSPDQMKLYGLQTQTGYNLGQTAVEQSSKLRSHLGQGVDTKGLQDWNAGPRAADANYQTRQDQAPTDRGAIENAMMALYNRQAGTRNAAEDAQLAARGASAGSPIGEAAAFRRGEEATDAGLKAYLGSGAESREAQNAYNQAAAQRWTMGGQESDRQNALRQAQWGERLQLRNQPINEITALMGGSGITAPQFSPYQGQGLSAAPVGGYMGQNYANSANATSQFNQGLFNFGSNLLGGATGAWGGKIA
jgi:hypothetical protein